MYRILWGRDRPTLRKIESTSGAIRGKYNSYEIQKYSLKIREIQNQGAPSLTSCPEVLMGTGHYVVAVIQPCAISHRRVARFGGNCTMEN